VIIGVMGAILGIGGGIFLVPALTIILDIDIKIAAATSLIAVIVTSSTSASSYVRKGLVNIRLGMFLEMFSTAGAVIGAILVAFLAPSAIEFILGIALIYAAIYMQIKRKSESKDAVSSTISHAKGRFDSEFSDAQTGESVRYSVKNVERGAAGSFVSGNLSGLIGIGGGIILVPVMNGLMRMPIKASTATSNFVLGVTALAGVLVYLSNGYVAPVLTAIVCIGVFAGASIGTAIQPRISGAIVSISFACLMILIAAIMFGRSLGWFT